MRSNQASTTGVSEMLSNGTPKPGGHLHNVSNDVSNFGFSVSKFKNLEENSFSITNIEL